MATYQREQLLTDLKSNVIELTVQQNGVDRTIRVSHAPAMLPANVTQQFIEEQHRNITPSSIVAWAVDIKSWFRFDVKDVRYAQVIDGYL